MAALDWSHCPAVERTPGKVSENLEDFRIDEVIEQFDVTREKVTGVLDFVASAPTRSYSEIDNPLHWRDDATFLIVV